MREKRSFGTLTLPRGRLWRSLAFYTAVPILLVVLASGAGLYALVRRSVERYALEEIRREMAIDARDLYSLCEQGFGQILRTGALGSPRQEALVRGRTLGAIEGFLRQRALEGRVVDGHGGEAVLELGSPKGLAAAAAARNEPGVVSVGDRRYAMARVVYEPWRWSVTLLRDLEGSAALLGEVRKTYLVAGLWVAGTGLLMSFVLGRVFRRPVTAILARLAAGERPTYRGISEFEHLSETIGRIVESEREQAARLAEAQRIAHLGHWLWDVEAQTVTWSDEVYPMFGLQERPSAGLAEAFWGAVHPDERSRVRQALVSALRGTAPFVLEFRIVRPDGQVRVLDSKAEVTRRSAGWAQQMSGTLHDITERKRSEEAILQARNDWESTFDAVTDIITVHDRDFNIILANPAAHAFLGLPAQGKGPTKCFSYYHGAEGPPSDCPSCTSLENGACCAWEHFEPHLGKHLEVRAMPRYEKDGQVAGLIHVVRDITQRKRAEKEKAELETQLQQAQKMESVGRLAGGVAHDFNNMLAVIHGHAEMALGQIDPAHSLHDGLVAICEAAERSADLTRQLLAFARKQTILPKVLDLNDAVAGMLKMLGRLIGENIELAWLPGPGLWPVRVDASQIDQILTNLCVNGRDSIGGAGRIVIETANITLDARYCAHHPGSVPGEYVRLAVNDNGCGMDKDTLAHAFEPFFTTKGVGHGTGLGLATVYGAVKQNGGYIAVYSEPGHGTTFQVYLPRHLSTASRVRAEGAAEPVVLGQETILLVEDEPTILGMSTKLLARLGYAVLAASTPDEALGLVREHAGEIHLLLTDVIMPKMNGRALADRLMTVYPQLKCLFMSGYTADVIGNHGVLEEGVHFIEKPFSTKSLAVKVREVLDSKSSEVS